MKYLSQSEQKRLLGTVKTVVGKQARRDYVMLCCGFNLGLRCREIVGLNVGDVRNVEKLYVRKEVAKRGRARRIPIHKDLQVVLKTFLRYKMAWREDMQDDAPLFISRKGGRISRRALQSAFEYWCLKAGLTVFENGKKRAYYTVHSMRHTFARRLRERGIKLEVIQKLLGHASLLSTGIYEEPSDEECTEGVTVLSSYRSKAGDDDELAVSLGM